jgi:hypothetical protein
MKKLIAAIAAAFLLMLGLTAVTEAPASAACPYSACINTTTTVDAPRKVRAHRSVPLSVRVVAPGNATPTGTVTVTVTRHGSAKYTSTQAYVGGTITFITQGFRHGRYSVTAVFNPSANSVFNGSSDKTKVQVKKRHRHHR